MQFGALRVLNDDVVKGGGGFDTHPHENMEIVSIPLKGTLTHKDSTGVDGLIYSGDVQVMSAGSGITHSEYNASHYDPVSFLQIWIFPKQLNIKPRQEQKSFDPAARMGRWQVLVSPLLVEGGLWINQDARLSRVQLDAGAAIDYPVIFPGNGVYVFLLDGRVEADGRPLESRDGLGISGKESFSIRALETSEVLAIEVPMFG